LGNPPLPYRFGSLWLLVNSFDACSTDLILHPLHPAKGSVPLLGNLVGRLDAEPPNGLEGEAVLFGRGALG
jgi:hypothetical protein